MALSLFDQKPTNAVDVDEKQIAGTESDSDANHEQPVKDWTDEEEKRLVRKVDGIVMPLLIAAFFVLQLDRGNM